MSLSVKDVRQPRSSSSRSPHPYRRRRVKKDDSGSSTEGYIRPGSGSSDASDHAIEADDEKGPLLRLPAPPVRASKGLKGIRDRSLEWTPVISPVATPSIEKHAYFPTPTVEESIRVEAEQHERYKRYVKRRRTEMVRRLSETTLLLAIGILSCFRLRWVTKEGRALHEPRSQFAVWTREVAIFIYTVGACYLLFPLRRSLAWFRNGSHTLTALRLGYRVPSRFDPGPLLYPVLLPLFIAASINGNDGSIPANIILGLSSMPEQVIPLSQYGGFTAHWILTLVPISRFPHLGSSPIWLKLPIDTPSIHRYELSLLFPLHKTMVTVISDLVTTSLDPAEVHLMATGLINLLVFATTPQSQLLKGLLWVGGGCLFVFCESPLKWEVALARIPAWRFARNRPSSKGLSGRFNRILQALLPEYRSRFASIAVSSDSDNDDTHAFIVPQSKINETGTSGLNGSTKKAAPHRTASMNQGFMSDHASLSKDLPELARSVTFSTFGRAATIAVRWQKIATSSNPFLRLTFLQAQAAKLGIALYTYLAVAFTILVPLRYFIATRALNGREPIGWAIGYFFGDIPALRLFTVTNNLDWWIALPTHKLHASVTNTTGMFERYQQHLLGPANTRLLLAAYCVFTVTCGIVAVLRLQKVVEVDTRRKVFHGVMVAMLLPTIPIDPCFFALALMIVLAIFLMLDLFRASQLPPISRPLTNFLAPYVDGRDHRGPVIVSHIFLLIGCAIPLWLSLAAVRRTGTGSLVGWDVEFRDLSMVSGVICVGMGDAAASLIGRRYGKTKWYWGGGKSIEGSAAFAFAVMIGLTFSWLWLRLSGWEDFDIACLPSAMLKSLLAGLGASLMESTLTAANDNVVVPIGLWLLVRGLEI